MTIETGQLIGFERPLALNMDSNWVKLGKKKISLSIIDKLFSRYDTTVRNVFESIVRDIDPTPHEDRYPSLVLLTTVNISFEIDASK